MLWRLPRSIRSLLISNQRKCLSTTTTSPLRILFCGSDDFSIASLRALLDEKEANQKLIESIEVVHKKGKRSGRGLKLIKDVPIKKLARALSLTTHEIKTFTGWTPPRPFDIVIAVSFGLLVPPRILDAARYHGLNVHPSLLPDLRGPAPIQHTLLKQRARTGVTVQTLHPTEFDRGVILAQTPPPGLDVAEGATCADLVQQLGALGGQMLVDVLRTGRFIPPYKEARWYSKSHGPVNYAEKITPAHRRVDFSTATAQEILTRHRVLGSLWFSYRKERFIIDEIRVLGADDQPDRNPGDFAHGEDKTVVARTTDGQLMEIQRSTCAGGKVFHGNSTLRRRIREASDEQERTAAKAAAAIAS